MADFLASNGVGLDGFTERPSLFELVAQEKMRELLGPAFKYILTVYAQRYPSRWMLAIHRFNKLLFAALMAAVELSYLKEWGGSFTENFYGMRRASSHQEAAAASGYTGTGHRRRRTAMDSAAAADLASPALTNRQIAVSLLTLIGAPLIKEALDDLYEKLTNQRASRLLGGLVSFRESFKQTAIGLFKRLYPYLSAAYTASFVAFQLAYLHGSTPYYDPWLWLAGLEIKRLTAADINARDRQMGVLSDASQREMDRASQLGRVLIRARMVTESIVRLVGIVFPSGIFMFRFLEWWYTTDYHKKKDTKPIPPPPDPVSRHPQGIPVPTDPQICPLCTQQRTNATMLASGYVFCYPCVFRYVNEHQRCPVTHMHATVESLRRIYQQ
eukprot:jgi/Hompol1/6760/HPOL_003717-RA